MGKAINAPFAGKTPAIDPVEDIKRPIGTNLGISGKDIPKEVFAIRQFKARSFGFELKAVNAAATRRAAKIHHKKRSPLGRVKARARVGENPGRPGANVQDGRDDMGGLLRMAGLPHSLGIPRATGVGLFQKLEPDAPARIATLDKMGPAGLIATIGIVVACEKVSHVVKKEFLGVTKACGKNL